MFQVILCTIGGVTLDKFKFALLLVVKIEMITHHFAKVVIRVMLSHSKFSFRLWLNEL
jgi:hypothetical protein